MSDRDERGRLRPGHKGTNQYTKQPPTQSGQPVAEPFLGNSDNSDDVVIYVSRNFGRKGLPKDGQIGYYVWLMEERPADFNAQHSRAIARKADEQIIVAGSPKIETVNILSCPTDHYIAGDQMRAMWEKEYGAKHKAATPSNDDEPSVIITPPPSQAASFDNDEDEQPYTMEEVKRMTEAQFDAAVAAGEIGFAGTKAQFDAAVAAGEIIIAGTDDE